MDALMASATPIHRPKAGPSRPRQPHKKPSHTHKTVDRGENKEAIDPSTYSVLAQTRLPGSFHQRNLATGSGDAPIRPEASISKIKDKKLRAKVGRNDVASKRAMQEREEVNEWLGGSTSTGGIEVDEDMGERSWRVKQDEIKDAVGVSAGAKKFDLRFENMGEYMVDYTRNGRHLAIASTRGHIATFDWQAGRLHSEIQLKETIRDIKFLQSESFYAVAQKRYVFIYDQNGVELHKLKQHIDPTHLEFLPYHYLLASLGHAGYLKYHDVSTGVMLTQIPTHLGSPTSMCQNPHSAIIHAGHTNGTVTLWSPNMTTPHVKLLAHRGPVVAMAVDGSEGSVGRYTATAGLDGTVKLWDGRMWGKELRSWNNRNTPSSIDFSQKGMLAVGGKSGVTVYRDIHHSTTKTPQPYLTLPLPGLTASSARFCPYDDTLAVGHGKGMSSLLVPGSGEPNFDSAEADVFESHSRRRERDVRSVMEKIRPELITMDTDFLGRVGERPMGTYAEREAKSYRQLSRVERLKVDGKADDVDDEPAAGGEQDGEEGEGDETPIRKEKEKYKARGKSGSMKKYLRKKKKNVIDPSLLAMRQKVSQQRKEADQKRRIENGEAVRETGALARFG